ncbi:hypothetical protein [Amycolatopsis sp. NPDC051102]|uniref:hypothetical protein n=1 Tax=Amycolatopsis sp. NPDC051102 TaxID=3155163 RepID=UPI0034307C68
MEQDTQSVSSVPAADHTSPVPSTPRTPPPRSRKLGGRDRREQSSSALAASLLEEPGSEATPPPFVPFTPPSVQREVEDESPTQEADSSGVNETKDAESETANRNPADVSAEDRSDVPASLPVEEAPEHVTKKADQPPPGQPKKASKKGKKAEPSEDIFIDEPTYPTSVYVLPEARAEAKKLCSKTGQVHASIAMDAIDEAIRADLLGHLIKERQTVPREADSRFPNRRATRRARPRAGGREDRTSLTRVLWQCHFTASELGVIEELIKETSATSLSELLAAATEWYVLKYLNADAEAPAEPVDLDRRR